MYRSRFLAAAGLCLVAAACPSGRSYSGDIDLEADQHLWSMGQTLAGVDAFTLHVFTTSEMGVDGGPVVEHGGETTLTMRRPDRLVATRRGDLVNRDVCYDGEALHVVDLNMGAYASEPIPESQRELGAVVDYLVEKYGLVLPLADFLYADPYEILIENAELGRDLGLRQVEDRPCQHLAFRQPNVDWQIWIETGAQPVPRKFVIKETQVEGEPEFCAEFDSWDLEAAPADDAFTFVPPDNMPQVSLAKLLGLEDEG